MMPRSYSSIDKIRAELAWVNETPDPNKYGCRNVRCCEETRRPGTSSVRRAALPEFRALTPDHLVKSSNSN